MIPNSTQSDSKLTQTDCTVFQSGCKVLPKWRNFKKVTAIPDRSQIAADIYGSHGIQKSMDVHGGYPWVFMHIHGIRAVVGTRLRIGMKITAGPCM